MFILNTGHQPGVYVPLRALFLVSFVIKVSLNIHKLVAVGRRPAYRSGLRSLIPGSEHSFTSCLVMVSTEY